MSNSARLTRLTLPGAGMPRRRQRCTSAWLEIAPFGVHVTLIEPGVSAAALMKVVDAEKPPLRVFFGSSPLETAKADYESRLRTWEEWQPVAELAQG